MTTPQDDVQLTRRQLVKTTAFLGGAVAMAGGLSKFLELTGARPVAAGTTRTSGYPLAQPENILYSACLNCTVSCSIKAKIQDGVLAKVDGNPYSAMTLTPNLPMATSPTEAATVDGKLCPKGQAGIQTLYDPYRLRQVLKRAGPRGSGKWVTIPFDQAVDEIVNGGALFASIGEGRHIQGLKEIAALRDAKVAGEMAADVAKIRAKQLTVEAFKAKHAANLRYLIDPDHPDLGPLNNQFLFQVGRIHNGRVEFTKRFVNNAIGSVNWIEKTTLCGQTSNKAWAKATGSYKDGKWADGTKSPRPDHANTEFLLAFGTVIFEANYGPVQQTEPITRGLETGRLKLAVVDPRLTKVAAKAWKWLPVRPGTDAALALGIARWMLDNNRYDASYLANANRGAATAAGEVAVSNATWLVKIDQNGTPGKHLRGDEAGLGKKTDLVVLADGRPMAFDPADDKRAVHGDLFVDTELNGIRVKSPLQLLREEASARTLAEVATLTGIPEADIVAVAKEFSSHGKKAAAEFYRGVVKHTNGWTNALAVIALNMLVGNFDAVGGTSKPGGQHDWKGGKEGQPFKIIGKHPGKLAAFGVPLTREGWQYEDSTLFAGYPAKRPWYPFSGNVAQEIFPSLAEGYPYPIKAALLAIHSPMYSIPGGLAQLEALLDSAKIPLYIACDIVVGETSMYADYIFPDVTYFERFGITQGSHHVRVKSTALRQPVVTPLTDTVTVNGERLHLSLETLLLAIADRMQLPGFGNDAFGPGEPLTRPEDWYLKLHVNVAYDGKQTPDVSPEELELFRQSHRHLAPSVYTEERWKQAVGAERWPKLVYLLNRGGRFDPVDAAYNGAAIAAKLGGVNRFYIEEVAASRHSMTGQPFPGGPAYRPVTDSAGKPVPEDEGEFHLVTYKEVWGTQSRTISNYWSQLGVAPENFVVINAADARRLQVADGDLVRLTSVSNPQGIRNLGLGRVTPVTGKVKAIEGIRPGIVAISTHFGHWAYGSTDLVVDGVVVRGDARRGGGIHAQPLFRLDEHLRGTPMSDPVGGSVSFYDTRVDIVKA